MALKLKFPGQNPCMFDGYDVGLTSLLGGEIVKLIGVPYVYPSNSTSDKAAADVFDGYVGTTTKVRPAVTAALGVTATAVRPLFLADEGTLHYGTLLGSLVGGVCGASVINPTTMSGATVLGPHTASTSGKVTCWDKPGLYAVTTDAVAASIVPETCTASPGDPLYADVNGKLTLTSAASHDNTSGTPTIVGRFFCFETNGSLVTTPRHLVSDAVTRQFTEMLFHFRIEN